MIANNFYPQFSKNKSHKLEKSDIIELLSTFKHFNSKLEFMSDSQQFTRAKMNHNNGKFKTTQYENK